MMEENYFKDAQIVSVSENDVITPDLVYIDDDDEETRSLAAINMKIKLTDGESKGASTLFNSESDNENPISIRVTPMEVDEPILNDGKSYAECIVANQFPMNIKAEIDEDCSIQDQEQFEIIEDNLEKNLSSSSNDSTRANKSNESNDHSYSQPPQSNNSFSDDIIKSLLTKSSLHNNPNAYKLLKDYTKFFENFVDEEQGSQLSLYIKQVMASLDNNKKRLFENGEKQEGAGELPTSPEKQASNFAEERSETESEHYEKTTNGINNNNEKYSSATEEFSETSIKSDALQIKQEVMETDAGIIIENKNENKIQSNASIDEEAEKLKVYVTRAQEKTAEFVEENQKLLESVFVADEDVQNGSSKFKTALHKFITFNVGLLMDVENKTDHTTVDEEIEKFKKDISSSRRRMSNISFTNDLVENDKPSTSRKNSLDEDADKKIKSRRSSTTTIDKDLSDSDTDSSINRLTNLKTLDQRSKKYEKTQNIQENPVKKSQKIKKKKEHSDDDSSMESDLSSDSESAELATKEDDKENATSEDEEIKLKQKIELRARNNLLASSDESDNSYVTSDTSEFSSDDERSERKETKKKKSKKVELFTDDQTDNEAEPKNSTESATNLEANGDDKELASPLDNDDSLVSQTAENGQERTAKKRQRTPFDREIFDKNLLADSDDEKASDDDELPSPGAAKKPRKESISDVKKKNDSLNGDIVDLTQPIEIKADRKAITLEKYIEKLSTNKVDDFEEPSSSAKLNDSRKSDQKSKAPSPSIDDIDCISISSASDSEISSTISEGTTRRRKQLTEEELKEETKKAKKDEAERVKKLEAKEQRMTQYITQRLSQTEDVAPDELVLDYSDEKNLAVVVHSNLVGKLKEHQVDGIKFMYNNCYGSIDEAKENNGSGCILAHCMGLGKTLQLIVLLHTVIRYPALHTKRVLIICPKSTIHNWAEEFRKWLHGMDGQPRVYYLEDHVKIEKRIDKLREWFESKKPSVFLINYESFRILANWSGTHKRCKISLPEETIKKYKQQISKYLLEPGPNLVVCDEGHIIKNQKGATNRAITKIKTRRRVILTGTPIQNALHEYYAMVEWVKPNILGTIHEFNNIYANPIKDGQNKDSTDHQIKKMKQKSYVLNKNLSKFVQRKDAQVLKEFLPKKLEYCISVPLTKVQEKLYNTFLQANRSGEMGRNLLPIYTGLRKIWTHPTVLQYAYERARRGEHKFGAHKDNQQKEKKPKDAFNEDDEEPDDVFDTSQGTTAVTNNWWDNMVTEQDMNSLTSSHKMLLLFEILRLCELKKEKILIFSSFVAVLDIIERFMKAIHNQANNPNAALYGLDKYQTTWELGKDYYRLDGSTPRNVRSEMINAFNNSPGTRLRCFLISAKAGGQGINLVAANRCIIVDTSWNPANDNQNIFRIFRLGQKSTCYVYRLVACSTMEERVYSRSVTKEAMSHRVIEKKQIDRHYVKTELEELFIPYELKPKEKPPNFPEDDILRYLLHAHPKSAFNYHEHDSLLENKPDQELNEDEMNEAWNSYLAELQGNRYQLQNMNNTMNANNPNMPNFGKNPVSSDFMKLYQDMMDSSSYANLAGMMPSTSSALPGLDSFLSSSYFPLSSNFYTHDLLKRFGSYDPLTSLYSSTSLPTSSAIHSTSTPPLMQSVLRNSQNPISALGNMSTTAPTTPSYNANNIPPASNSIFAQPSTTNNTQSAVPNLSFTASTSTTTKPKKKLVSKYLLGKNTQITPGLGPRPYVAVPSKNQILATKNSSENISILPDMERSPPSILSKSIAGTSARTHQVLAKNDRLSLANKIVPKPNVIDNGNARSLIRPNVITTLSKNPSMSTSPVLAKSQNSNVLSAQLSRSITQTPQTMFDAGKKNSPVEMRKMPSFSKNSTSVNKKPIPMNLITSGTKSPLNRSSVVLNPVQKPTNNLGTATPMGTDSVSIIRLPSKSNNPTLKPAAPSSSGVMQQKSPISKGASVQKMTKILQQQQRRIIDNQTNQTLKRMKINESQSLSQSSQQTGLLRIPGSQQINSQQRVSQVNPSRLNSPAVPQRAVSFQQIIQNSPRGPKSSQQANKNPLQVPSEIVEVDD